MINENDSPAKSLLNQCIELNYPRITQQDFAELKEALLQTYLRLCLTMYNHSLLQAVSTLVCDVERIKEKSLGDDE